VSELFTVENLIALCTLTLLEVVLGIDNIVFLSILTGKLESSERGRARRLGLFLAMFMRIGLLLGLSFVMKLTQPIFSLLEHGVSGRDLILLGGGLFLIAKATHEIHAKLEGPAQRASSKKGAASFGAVIVQIVLIDIIFSLDSVITAVGMAQHLAVMIAAVVLAVGAMMVFAGAVGEFVERHPTIKMLALAFLILIGVMLVAEGMGKHVEKGYIYFAMAFALLVELINLRVRRVSPPVELHGAPAVTSPAEGSGRAGGALHSDAGAPRPGRDARDA
jgi:predicted tellurium resistance membrane protein TerC